MLAGLALAVIVVAAPTMLFAWWPVSHDRDDRRDDDADRRDTIIVDLFDGEDWSPPPAPPEVSGRGRPAANADFLTGAIIPVEEVTGSDRPLETWRGAGDGNDTVGPYVDDPFAPPGGSQVYVPDTQVYEHAAAVEQPPELIHIPQPGYPPMARKLGQEGTVILHILVGIDGRARDVQIATESNRAFGFGEFAVRAARKAHFRPAIHNSQAVRCWVSLPVEFALRR
jgi:TonB family protein